MTWPEHSVSRNRQQRWDRQELSWVGCVTGLDIQKEVQRKTMGMCSVVGEEVWAGPQISRGFCSRKRHCLRRYLPWKLRAEPPWETQAQGKQLKEQSQASGCLGSPPDPTTPMLCNPGQVAYTFCVSVSTCTKWKAQSYLTGHKPWGKVNICETFRTMALSKLSVSQIFHPNRHFS